MTTVYIGLGSNLGDRLANLRAAAEALHDPPRVVVLRCSPVYETDPVGPPQPSYLNAVAEVRTDLEPLALLDRLKDAERRVGRKPGERWGPREIDLDLLLYGNRVVHEAGLRVPHPEMVHRAFVLVPMADLAPDAIVPGRGSVRDLLHETGRSGVREAYPPTALAPTEQELH